MAEKNEMEKVKEELNIHKEHILYLEKTMKDVVEKIKGKNGDIGSKIN